MPIAPTAAGLPRAAQYLAAFEAAQPPTSGSTLLRLAYQLCRQNLDQWTAEDVCRHAGREDAAVADAKRKIDKLNANRVSLIEAIDTQVSALLRPQEGAALHTETLGMVVDRLSVAWIRARQLEQLEPKGDRAFLAKHQLAELSGAYDRLLDDLRSGQRTIPGWKVLKTYGERNKD